MRGVGQGEGKTREAPPPISHFQRSILLNRFKRRNDTRLDMCQANFDCALSIRSSRTAIIAVQICV